MCGCTQLGKGLAWGEEPVVLQHQEVQEVRVVQHLREDLGFRELLGVPWVRHVRVDLLELREALVDQLGQEDRRVLAVLLVRQVLEVPAFPWVRPFLAGQEVVGVAEVVAVGAVVVVVEGRVNNMLLDKQEHMKKGILVDTD